MTSVDILKGSFPKFLFYVFTAILGLPAPTRIQQDIARFLSDSDNPLRFIQAFRGIGKSFLTCVYVVWRLWREPNLKVLIVSANETLATENATLIKLLIEHHVGDALWSELRPRPDQRSSTLAFDVGPAVPDKSPSVKVVGITGQLTGSRSDILISDDVEVPKNSQTETQRDRLRELTGEYTDIAKTGSEIIYLGTPQSQESIYKALPGKGYATRVWPGRYPLAAKLSGYLGTLAPLLQSDIDADPALCKPIGSTLAGSPTDPKRFNEHEMMLREVGRGPAGFALQYLLDTTLSDADRYPLKTRDLIVTDVDAKLAPIRLAWGSAKEQVHLDLDNVGFTGDRFHRPMFISPDFQPFTGTAMIIDPSGRGKDETAYCVSKFLNGYIYIRKWGGFRDGYSEETLRSLVSIAKDEGVSRILCEDTFGDGMFRQLMDPYLRRQHPHCSLEGYKRFTQKEVRILDVLRPALAQHRVVIDTAVIRADLLQPENVKRGMYQLTHLTSQRGSLKHDDRVEVLAEAVKVWAEYLNADAHNAEAAFAKAEQLKWDKAFFAGTFVGQSLEAKKRPQRASGRSMVPKARKGIRW